MPLHRPPPASVAWRTGAAALVAAALLVATGVPAHAGIKNFIAVLNAGQETPPIPSSAIGNAFLFFDTKTKVLCYAISYQGLAGAETATHLHGPASPGTGAGVLVDISPMPPGPSPLGSPKDGCIDLSADKDTQKALKKGQVYINVHSSAHPTGEIRGQVIPVKGK